MKSILSMIVFLSFWNCFSQIQFDKTPENAKEIHFVYEKKSNYYIDERGVFADTLLYQVDFPKLKYTKVISPSDSLFVCGFIKLKDFNDQEKRKLSAILYHANEKMKGEFNIKKNITIIKVERNDSLTRQVFKKHLKSSYSYFGYTITMDYNKKTIFLQFPLVEYLREFKNDSKVILYSLNKLSGIFKEEREEFIFENIIVLNDVLSNKIVPGQIFTNNAFGVEKIKTVYNTIQLKSVSYK